MLPVPNEDGIVQVTRVVDADLDDALDVITDFVASKELEADRTDRGTGTLFRPRADRQGEGPWMFGDHDSLRVVITTSGNATEITLTADLGGMHRRGGAWQMRRYVRGGLLAAIFIGVGISDMVHGVNGSDFIPIGIGAWLGLRAVRRAQAEPESRIKIERYVANALERVCDDVERD